MEKWSTQPEGEQFVLFASIVQTGSLVHCVSGINCSILWITLALKYSLSRLTLTYISTLKYYHSKTCVSFFILNMRGYCEVSEFEQDLRGFSIKVA